MRHIDRILHWSPRILAVVFAAFLCLFALDGFDGMYGWQAIGATVIHLAVPAAVIIGAAVAWKRDLAGAIIFCAFAAYYVYQVGLDRHWSWYTSISGPALLIALLFFINWLRRRRT